MPPASATADRHGPPLTRGDLNRALLARQHLSAPSGASVLDEVRHLVGLQSQVPTSPYPALWARLAAFDPADLSRLLTERAVVRTANLRGTVHLVASDDALELAALARPAMAAYLRAKNQHGDALRDVDTGDLERAARDLLAEPLTSVELGRRLGERWPDVDPTHLAYGARLLLPLVQVPPRGLWGASGAGTTTTWTTAQAWLGRTHPDLEPATRGDDPERMLDVRVRLVRRYLAAFGPASVADAQQWAGLTRLRATFDVLRGELVTFTGPDGKELFDVPDAPRPAPDDDAAPVPRVILAGDFDNLVLSHADRSRVLGDLPVRSVVTVNGQVAATVLVDGYVTGAWKVRVTGEGSDAVAQLEVRPLRAVAPTAAPTGGPAPPSSADRLRDDDVRDALVARGEAWLRCGWPDARPHVVVTG